jgi:hypothetical protein
VMIIVILQYDNYVVIIVILLATLIGAWVQMDVGAGRTEAATVELTLGQFYGLLQEMEKAKAAVDFLAA